MTQPVLSADSILGVHMKTNGAQHPKLKELFFPSCELPRDGSPIPDRVARFTSVFWVAHIFVSETQKHWKAVNFANSHGTKQPASFFYSQVEQDALKADRDAKLKAARETTLRETKGDRDKKRAEKEKAANRKRTERKKV
jgi:hypothetical protein